MSARHQRQRWVVVVSYRDGCDPRFWAHGPYLTHARAVKQASVLIGHARDEGRYDVVVAQLEGGPIRLSDYPQ